MYKTINDLGEELVKCSLKCEGINNNPKLGAIPRGLFLEKRNGKKRCIVVGLNPGKCKEWEREYFRNNGIKFDSLSKSFHETNLKSVRYFKRTRDLITSLGFDGDILWTELVKCECIGENGKIPVQTLRVCIDRFLRKEVKLFECQTIFSLGNMAFDFCALSLPNHFVVGLPHPSGSYGDFNRLKERVLSDTKRFTNIISETKDSNGKFRAIHLSKVQDAP
jgi:uracil-DNA glycosylase